MLHYILMYYTLFQHHLQVPYPHTSLYVDDAYIKERIRKKERSYNKIDRVCRVGESSHMHLLPGRYDREGLFFDVAEGCFPGIGTKIL